jgi:hypothetical protein
VAGGSSAVKNAVSTILDGLVASFSWVLVLLMGFTLPVVNVEGAKNVSDVMTNNGLATVTDESQRGTTLNDIVF